VAELFPVKTCAIEQVLSPGTLKLLKLMPDHEVHRTLALSELKRPLPDECKTFAQIQEWVEFNIKKDIIAPKPTSGITAILERKERVSGNCRFTETQIGRHQYTLDDNALRDLLENAVDNEHDLDWFLDSCEDRIREFCDEEPPDMEGQGDYQYDNHETEETVHTNTVIRNSVTFREMVYDYVRDQFRAQFNELQSDNDEQD